jgi:hypothetical protein
LHRIEWLQVGLYYHVMSLLHMVRQWGNIARRWLIEVEEI